MTTITPVTSTFNIYFGSEQKDVINKVQGSERNVVIASQGGDDVIDISNAGDNLVFASNGNNQINVSNSSSNTVITTGNGNNSINGNNSDNNYISTGGGNDVINLDGSESSAIFDAGGNNTISGGINDSIETGDGIDTIYSNIGNDTINTGGGNDKVFSGTGQKTISLGDGDDEIISYGNKTSADSSVIDAGNGNDKIADGKGNDTYKGGAGSDTFDFSFGGGNDIITDFARKDLLVFKKSDGENFTFSKNSNNQVVIGYGQDKSVTLANIQYDNALFILPRIKIIA